MSNRESKLLKNKLRHVVSLSPFFKKLLNDKSLHLNPDILEKSPKVSNQLIKLASKNIDEEDFNEHLRRCRRQLLLEIIVRDLSTMGSLGEVLTAITAFAETAILASVEYHKSRLEKLYGIPKDSVGRALDLHVIGMGKLGGSELNVSSDVDLIFLYPEDGRTDGQEAIENKLFFKLLALKVVDSLQKRTSFGLVFRVDTRLRPFGLDGPYVASFKFLNDYFYHEATPWDRLAWVKARPVCGSRVDDLRKIVRPFVFRKYFDFSVIDDLKYLHTNIQKKLGWGRQKRNIKLGFGGIREIEFIVQVIQLARGGYKTELRGTNTLSNLEVIETLGLLNKTAVEELTEAYIFLRNLEHRLMYLEDKQTQLLPLLWHNKKRIAASMNFTNYGSFKKALFRVQKKVNQHFRTAFWREDFDSESDDLVLELSVGKELPRDASSALRLLGFKKERDVITSVRDFRAGTKYREITEKNKKLVDLVIVRSMRICAKENNADGLFISIIRLLERICRRESYLTLMIERPIVLKRVIKIADASFWGIEFLAKYPILMADLESTSFDDDVNFSALQKQIENDLKVHEGDVEAKMNVLRHYKNSYTLKILNRDLRREMPVENVSDLLSSLADCILSALLKECWHDLKNRKTDLPSFAIIGYGKLGSKEIGYMSDLDIIFLYRGDDSDDFSLYANLAKRLCGWLRTTTSFGALYEVDLQLRPHGASGVLVTSIDVFEEYLASDAWMWEYQALTKARAIAGDKAICEDFEMLRKKVLAKPRQHEVVVHEIIPMRERMISGLKTPKDKFDIKNSRGGLIDVEFCIQALILCNAHKFPEFADNIGNLALLELAAKNNLIPEHTAKLAAQSYRYYRKLQHAARLSGEADALVDQILVEKNISAVKQLMKCIF